MAAEGKGAVVVPAVTTSPPVAAAQNVPPALVRMAAESRAQAWGGLLLRIALFALAVYFFWRVQTIVTTVVVSLIIAAAASVMVEPLCHRRVPGLRPHTQRVLATSLVFVLMFFAVFWSVKTLVSPFETEFKKLSANLPVYQAALEKQVVSLQEWYQNLPPWVREQMAAQQGKVSVPSPTAYLGEFLKKTSGMISHVVELILVPVLAFYFTLDGRTLRNQFLFLVPRGRRRQALAILSEGGGIMRTYIVAQFLLAVIAGVAVWAGLSLLRMDYALILGLFAGITRAIPVIGPLLGGVPLVLLTFVYGAQNNMPLLWVWALLFFTLLHLFESKILMPNLLGHALELHAVVVIIALLIGGEFFGLMGMFLAAPVAALLRVLLVHYVIRPRRRAPRRPPGPRPARRGFRVLSLERAVRHRAAAAAASTAAATGAAMVVGAPPVPSTAHSPTAAESVNAPRAANLPKE